ncbi:MAG: DHHA1 domain-containing protein, partial [Rhodospirillales bacterium]
DVQKKVDALFVHVGVVEGAALKLGDEVQLSVDKARRANIRANHSATHLLHAALRKRLGDHVTQKGSLVAPDRLRFDISHPKPVSAEELSDAEAAVNEQIKRNTEIATHLMEPDAAVKAGAMALFGEKYGDEVRVVSIGSLGGSLENAAYSTELCGGTHVKRTGDIRVLKILSEGAVSAGVRRIEALTGDGAAEQEKRNEASLTATTTLAGVGPGELLATIEKYLAQRRDLEGKLIETRRQMATGVGVGSAPVPEKGTPPARVKDSGGDVLAEVAALLKVRPVEVPERVEALRAECSKLESEIEAVRRQIDSGANSGAGGARQKDIAGITYSPRLLEGVPAKELKSLADDLKSQIGSGVVALVSVAEGKASVVVGVTDDLVERISAVDLVRVGSVAVGGKGGGGRPNMAQAGGPNGAKGQTALDEIESAIREAG